MTAYAPAASAAPATPAAPTAAGRGAASRLPSLTGLRFFAAALVFLFHSSRIIPPLTPFHGATAHWYMTVCTEGGWVGVSFFFILSGFVLTWVAKPTDRARRFWRRRLTKLYPNHIVTFVVTTVLLSVSIPWWRWLPNLLLVQSWFPDTHLDIVFSVDQPSWSLSCEIVFYLCFPLLYRQLLRIAPERLWTWAGAMVAAIVAAATFAQFALPSTPAGMVPGQPVFPASQWQVWFVYAFPPVRMLEFVLGMLLARIVLTGRWIKLPLAPVLLLVFGSYAAAYAVPWVYSAVAVCVVPLALLIPTVATIDIHGRRSPFSGVVLVWLGEISFAFYLVHGICIAFVRSKVGYAVFGSWTAAGMVLLPFAMAVVGAWLLNSLVEKPMMKYVSRPASERRARAESAAAGPTDGAAAA
jgi:peptidoglycan/LPS O-acetylase OafA/YrhL